MSPRAGLDPASLVGVYPQANGCSESRRQSADERLNKGEDRQEIVSRAERCGNSSRGRGGESGAPGRARTYGLQIRSLALYPTELRARTSRTIPSVITEGNLSVFEMGWVMGLEPTKPGATVQCSTIELHPPYLMLARLFHQCRGAPPPRLSLRNARAVGSRSLSPLAYLAVWYARRDSNPRHAA